MRPVLRTAAAATAALLVAGAAPAFASFSFEVPVTTKIGQPMKIGAVTCGNTVEGTWYWGGRQELAFTMPGVGGTFGTLDKIPAAAGTRTGPKSVEVTWRPDVNDDAMTGPGTIVDGVPDAHKSFCAQRAPKPKGRVNPRHKELLRRAAARNRDAAKRALLAINAKNCAKSDPATEAFCASLLESAKQASRDAEVQERVANDPPDRAFRVVARPAKARIARIPGAGRAVKRMLSAQARAGSLRKALLTAIERAEGAVVHGGPGDVAHESRQMEAAARYATQLADALGRLRTRSVAAVRALKRARVSVAIDAAAARAAQQKIAASGLPAETRRWGLTEEQLEALRKEIVEADPATLTVKLPGALASPAQQASWRGEAQASREFAARVRKNPTAPAT